MTVSDIKSLQADIQAYQDTAVERTPKVKFLMDSTMTVTDFLSCFECQVQPSSDKSSPITVCLCQGLTESRKMRLGKFIVIVVFFVSEYTFFLT